MANVNIQFMRNPVTGRSKQEEFYFLTCRNQCFSGGYGNGKSFIGCFKAYTLLSHFPKYRMAILRASSLDLHRTTMATFFKICPPDAYNQGGNRVDSRNYLQLNNGSEVFWMHLDEYDENLVRGLELNSYLIDQAEEIDENIYSHLDVRIDRWDVAEVPEELNPDRFPKNPVTGKPKPPAYGMILCNPDVFSHWIYRYYHPDSYEHNEVRETKNPYTGEVTQYRLSDTHKMIQASSYDNPSLSPETLRKMESRGPAFVKRFVLGEWGSAGGAIHEVSTLSKLQDPPKEFITTAIRKGQVFLALDHGDAAPTAVTWIAKYKGWLIVFQEYYKAHLMISEHRVNIGFLNIWDELHMQTTNVCDPSMANKTQQKKGGLRSLIDEYATSEYEAPPLNLMPADNNEFLTRSRLQEVLRIHPEVSHPITGVLGAPILYFVKKSAMYPHGCDHVLSELESQKYEKIGTINGEDIFGDDREESVVDHAYDSLRYNIARIMMYGDAEQKPAYSEDSFEGIRQRAIRQQKRFKKMAGVNVHSINRRY